MDEQTTPRTDRSIDLESLKALAHPLRVQILDALSTYGEFTASGLAERLGESSGATSYHLRQLAKHDFVREVEGKGTARERWWKRSPGGIMLDPKDIGDSPSAKVASQLVLREWVNSRENALRAFIDNGDTLSPAWMDASTVMLSSVNPTADQLAEFVHEIEGVVTAFAERYRGQTIAGSRPVQIQFNAFPVIDAEERR
jgi:DNA-binding transcriptional ArsR family regulator